MKTRLIIAIIFFNLGFLYAQNINPAWQFVGPRATNEPVVPPTDPNYNPFRSGQIDDITVDPSDPAHIIVSSFFAGIWETYNYDGTNFPPRADWLILPAFDNPLPVGLGLNGVNAVEFRNTNELYAASSNAVYKYDYNTLTWTQLGSVPNASQTSINQIVFFPNDPDHVFLCTNLGLVESTDAGSTWFQAPAGNPIVGILHGIVFIEKTTPGTYFWYVSGQDPSGHALLMESTDDGSTFNNVTQFTNLFSNIFSFAGICLGDQNAANGDRDIYISSAINLGNNWTTNDRQIHRLRKSIISGSITVTYLTATGQEFVNGPWRLIIGYDSINKKVITGGVRIHANNVTAPYNSIPIGNIHDDYHAIYINTVVNPNLIFLGCDGGFASVRWNGSSYTSTRLNYGLDICLVNGFAGATESNIYVYGYQDHSYSDLYNETTGKVIATHSAGENDGGLIDKFDGNLLIISDNSSYNSTYYVSTNGVSNFSSASSASMYLPKSSPSYYFEPDLGSPFNASQLFGMHPYFQLPFRQGRIYCTARGGSVFQYDPISRKFVYKVRLQEEIQHFTCSPSLKSEPCPSCAPCTTSTFLRLHYLGYQGQPVSVSFSQLDNNIMYLVTANNPDLCCRTASQVVQYIGNNLDDIWLGHNECQDNNGNAQWQLITPDWQSTALGNMIESDIYHIQYTGVETSNWDKNKIYISCASDLIIPYKVIIYNGTSGTWSDYSTGIPTNENVKSMIMDHASNDGIYISTENGIYYREAGMSAWVYYNTSPPGKHLPFVRCTQMEINYRENTVRAGTYGRGIWKSDLVCPSFSNFTVLTTPVSGYTEAEDITTNGTINTGSVGSTVFRATNSISLEPGFTADATLGTNYFTAFIHGCIGGSTSSYNYFRTNFDFSQTDFNKDKDVNNYEKKLIVYPNPAPDKINVGIAALEDGETAKVYLFDDQGKVLLMREQTSKLGTLELGNLKAGIYYIKVYIKSESVSYKIVKL